MPFYEYECPSCKHTLEVLQKIGDKPLGTCPSCGKRGLRRLVSAPVFRLKGSGWYETDFKSDKENKRNLVGGEAEPKSETKTEAKSETQADTKADAPKEAKTDAKAEAKPDNKAESRPATNKRKTTPRRAAAPARRHK